MSNDNNNTPDNRPQYYKTPGPSAASRRITLKSSASCRGFLVNCTQHCWAGYESTLERDLLTILLTRPEVSWFQEQPDPVVFINTDGKPCKHTFDLLIHLRDGRTIACDVKPANRQAKSGIDEVHRLIQEQHPNYADKYIVRTDREISRDLVRNAELIQRARTLWDEAAIEELRQHLTSMHGVFRLASLVALFDDEATGFNAVLNLIDRQELKLVEQSRINDNTELEVRKAA